MNRNLVAQFILRLQDGVSAGLTRLQQRLMGLRQVATRVAIAGTALAGLSLAGPIREAAAFEDRLRQAGQTAGLTGAALDRQIARQAQAYQSLARSTGQSSTAIAEAAGLMLAAGLPQELVDRFLPTLARMATGTGAQLQDLGRLMPRLSQNLGIESVEEMEGALAALIQSSRDGGVEIANMVRLFPSLTAQVEALGIRGRPAVNMLGSMLQVALRGAATADEAGTNLANFLSKLTAPETVRNFREMGVNLEGVLQNATRRGINPIEAVIQTIRSASGGNMFRVGELFGDMQVLNFLRPMMGNVREYLQLLRGAAAAQAGLINQSFENRFRGFQVQFELLGEQVTQLFRRIGIAAAPMLVLINGALERLLGWIDRFDGEMPGVIDRTVQWGMGLTALGVAAAGVALAAKPLIGFLAALASPIGVATAVAIGLGVAAWQIYKNWEGVSTWFAEEWRKLREGMAPQVDWLMEVVARPFGRMLIAAWGGVAEWARGFFGGLRDSVNSFIEPVLSNIRELREAWDAIRARMSGGAASAPAPTPEEARSRFGSRGAAGGFYGPGELAGATAPPAAANGNAPVGGEIVVRAAPGTEVLGTTSTSRKVPITVDRGGTRSRN